MSREAKADLLDCRLAGRVPIEARRALFLDVAAEMGGILGEARQHLERMDQVFAGSTERQTRDSTALLQPARHSDRRPH